MPTIPRSRCAALRCTLSSVPGSSMCADHAPARRQAPSREDLHQYKTKAWQTMRQAQLSRQPMCAGCKDRGQIRAASVIDHVWPWRAIGLEAFRVNRLQSLCPDCHSTKTGLESRGIVREYGVRDWALADYRSQMGQD